MGGQKANDGVVWCVAAGKGPVTLEETLFAQSPTDRPVKGMLTGPVTMIA